MRTQSNTQPTQAFKIERLSDVQCDVLFFENVTEIEKEEQLNYEYDMYRLPSVYRDNLSMSIEENYDEWLEFAKQYEESFEPNLTTEEAVMVLNHTQEQQDTKITTSLLANTELFEMILGMLPQTMSTKAAKSEGVNKMVEVYVTLIIEGQKTLEQVPAIIRAKVEEQLKVLGVSI